MNDITMTKDSYNNLGYALEKLTDEIFKYKLLLIDILNTMPHDGKDFVYWNYKEINQIKEILEIPSPCNRIQLKEIRDNLCNNKFRKKND